MRYPQLSGTLLTQSLNVLSTSSVVQVSLIFLGSLSELKGVTSVRETALHLSGLHLLNQCRGWFPKTLSVLVSYCYEQADNVLIMLYILLMYSKRGTEFLPPLLCLLRNQVSRFNCGFITEKSPNVLLIIYSYQSDGKLGIPSSWLPLLGKRCLCSCQFGAYFAVITCMFSGFFYFLF